MVNSIYYRIIRLFIDRGFGVILLKLFERIYNKLTPWQKVQVARHPDRPHTVDYINIASVGDASDFGNMSVGRNDVAGTSGD